MKPEPPPVGRVPRPGPKQRPEKRDHVNSWPKTRIADALRLINGRAFKPAEWSKSGLPIVRIQNLNNPQALFNHYQGELPEKFKLQDGDLLFA